MKKIILTVCLVFSGFVSFAYDCSDPNKQYTILLGILGTYTCGYTNEPGTICYAQAQGTGGAGATGCQTEVLAPINGGLIFLIIAGAGLGAYTLYKKQPNQSAA